jgi:hypothetical protein
VASKQLTTTKAQLPADLTPMQLLQVAVMQGAGAEAISTLAALSATSREAEKVRAFNVAMAEAKKQIPVILKTNPVIGEGGRTYKHEDLASIAVVVDPILVPLGLSYRFNSESSHGEVKITCVITHVDGHSERNSLAGPTDTSGGKNAVQAIGSTVTYLQRYTLKLALGLIVAKDDDGVAAGSAAPVERQHITREQHQELLNLISEVGTTEIKVADFAKVEKLSMLPADKFAYTRQCLIDFGKRQQTPQTGENA